MKTKTFIVAIVVAIAPSFVIGDEIISSASLAKMYDRNGTMTPDNGTYGFGGGMTLANLFDGNFTTGTFMPRVNSGAYCLLDFTSLGTKGCAITEIKTGNQSSFSYSLYYSQNGAVWTPVDGGTNVQFAGTKTFSVNAIGSYVKCVFDQATSWNPAFAELQVWGMPYPSVIIVSSSIRENDPTILDVVYKVLSDKPTVKVRALAFEDGERSFAKVVRPETFIEGTDTNIGDNVAANVEHTLSWKVSADWATRLAKVKFEVLFNEGELMPLELRTIPASDQYGPMEFSWNEISDSQVFDALLWLYADKDPGLTLSGGLLKGNGVNLAKGSELANSYYFDYRKQASNYLFSKMGYTLLSGTVLAYVNGETRLGLSPDGVRQYAYKIVTDGE